MIINSKEDEPDKEYQYYMDYTSELETDNILREFHNYIKDKYKISIKNAKYENELIKFDNKTFNFKDLIMED